MTAILTLIAAGVLLLALAVLYIWVRGGEAIDRCFEGFCFEDEPIDYWPADVEADITQALTIADENAVYDFWRQSR